MTGVGLIIALALCVMVQAFFAASEIALVSVDEVKVRAARERGERKARLLDRLLVRRDRMLALTLTGTNLATVVAAVFLTTSFHEIQPRLAYLAPFILAPLTVLTGEAIPKLVTLKRADSFARVAAAPLGVLAAIMAPLLVVETALSRAIRALAGIPPHERSVFLSREELDLLILRKDSEAAGQRRGGILPAEQKMISRVFRFKRAEARKVMVPLVNVAAVSADTPVADAIEVVRREGFSRLPVFEGHIVDIIGVVHVFDLLEAPDTGHPVGKIMRPVSYFPESTPLDEVLLVLQRTGHNLAVVVDEYGGAIGILTIEDLLEEIVGEIEDEYDAREELAKVANPRTLVVSSRATVAELNERFALGLPESDDYATIAGLVTERLGHIPKPGEQLSLSDLIITVTRSDARAVRELVLLLGRPLKPELTRRK